jgi:two-component system response regulator PilR (NtrC family)
MTAVERRQKPRDHQVLVVDDEPDIRELLELTLLKMGLGVTSVPTIAEAKERLKDGRFQLCLTDMRLPDGEGSIWCATSRACAPTCRWQ